MLPRPRRASCSAPKYIEESEGGWFDFGFSNSARVTGSIEAIQRILAFLDMCFVSLNCYPGQSDSRAIRSGFLSIVGLHCVHLGRGWIGDGFIDVGEQSMAAAMEW